MRLGQNPAKSVMEVHTPEDISIVLMNYIPFMSGYYAGSLEVLKTAINSILENTPKPYDLMVFDNGSCAEAQDYLLELKNQKLIQRLVLSDINIGKVNAWNFILRATTGKIVVFTDADVYFHPGWLEAHLKIMNTYPNVGMLTGRPLRNPLEFSTKALEWAEEREGVSIERGLLQSWEHYKVHADSVGMPEEEAKEKYAAGEDILVTYKDVKALLGAGHFQFMTTRKVLDSILPLDSYRPLGDDRQFDILVNESGALRLSVPELVVEHMGNNVPERLKGSKASPPKQPATGIIYRISNIKLIRKILMRIYNIIFRLYYDTER